jgi:hypothetical protein
LKPIRAVRKGEAVHLEGVLEHLKIRTRPGAESFRRSSGVRGYHCLIAAAGLLCKAAGKKLCHWIGLDPAEPLRRERLLDAYLFIEDQTEWAALRLKQERTLDQKETHEHEHEHEHKHVHTHEHSHGQLTHSHEHTHVHTHAHKHTHEHDEAQSSDPSKHAHNANAGSGVHDHKHSTDELSNHEHTH